MLINTKCSDIQRPCAQLDAYGHRSFLIPTGIWKAEDCRLAGTNDQ
jgi:hypothetical protein